MGHNRAGQNRRVRKRRALKVEKTKQRYRTETKRMRWHLQY